MHHNRVLVLAFLLGTAACAERDAGSPGLETAGVVDTISEVRGESGNRIREESGAPPPPEPSRAALPSAEAERVHLKVTPREETAERATSSQLVFYISTPEGQAACPAEILVTDPEGRRTGVDPTTEQLLREIPGASYDEAGISLSARSPCGEADEDEIEVTPKLIIQIAQPGEYQVTVVGKAAGAYTLYIDQYPSDWRLPSRRIQPGQGTIEAGQIEIFEVRVEG